MDSARSPSPFAGGAPSTARFVEIETNNGQEVIQVPLDDLDANPDDLIDLLSESRCTEHVWTKLAAEYCRVGILEAAEKIGNAAVKQFASSQQRSLAPVYALLCTVQLAYARAAPKMVLATAKRDNLTSKKTKETYFSEATRLLNLTESSTPTDATAESPFIFSLRGILQLARGQLREAYTSFENVLKGQPRNVVALLGQARVMYTQRRFREAFEKFGTVLRLNPNCRPDPRIGLGLCCWSLDQKDRARAAWERSLDLDPNSWPAYLLLGLDAINNSKEGALSIDDKANLYQKGTRYVERAFKMNQRSAAATNALCEILLGKDDLPRALKLAERTIQYADTLSLLTDGYIRAGRVCAREGSISDAMAHFSAAHTGQPKNALASIGLAQTQLKNGETSAAIHTLETLTQTPNIPPSPEALLILASIRSHPRPGISSSELPKEKLRARETFDQVSRILASGDASPSARRLVSDIYMHLEIAHLWQEENTYRVQKSLEEALRIAESDGLVDPRILNNLGALAHMDGKLEVARTRYEEALTRASTQTQDDAATEGMTLSILYNLARVYEDSGDEGKANEAYDKLLARHPEYIDAKIRQAQMLSNQSRIQEAHELLKQALAVQADNLNLRAFYTHFLLHFNMPKYARDFVFSTLKDYDKHDIYGLCAAGWVHYHTARETREVTGKAGEERRKGFQRAAEFYEKALSLDPLCAVAAQGLAIVTAEDWLDNAGGMEDSNRKVKAAREALDVFGKVRESLHDGSVYANMGHCYYARDEFDRAIESYETASKRFYNSQNVSVLLCLCRSWYAKANQDQSFTAMTSALQYAQKALHIQPNDKAIVYNIAMIEQKSAEMLFALPPAKRSLRDLQRSIDQALHAQKLFLSLAEDPSPLVPYNKDIADQRKKYGDGLLRRAEEHLAAQQRYDAEAAAKIESARQKRQEEKDRQQAIRREKEDELRRQAEALAEKRKKDRETVQEWNQTYKADSDEERERKAKRAPRKKKGAEEEDALFSGEDGEPRKKRARKAKAAKGDGDAFVVGDDIVVRTEEGDEQNEADVDVAENGNASADDGPGFSDVEDAPDDKPAKRVPKKRVVREDDDEEIAASAVPRKKQFKSKEIIEDSDEEMS